MTNAYFTDIKQYKDMPTLNEYQYQLKQGADMTSFMKKIQFECRDNGRTPFQWDSSANAGFTTGIPWLSINPNYTTINKAAQDKDPNSVLNYFRKIVAIRKSNPILVYGKYTLLDKENPSIYAYTREWENKKWLVLLNFSAKESSINLGYHYRTKKQIINNYSATTTDEKLRPYEAVVYEL
jgi:oligo-1,6-glucosidase